MDDADGVRLRDALERLRDVVRGAVHGQPAELLDLDAEIIAGEQLHHHVRLPVRQRIQVDDDGDVGLLSWAAARASRSNRANTPGAVAVINLIATLWPRTGCRASKIVPIPPSPMRRRTTVLADRIVRLRRRSKRRRAIVHGGLEFIIGPPSLLRYRCS